MTDDAVLTLLRQSSFSFLGTIEPPGAATPADGLVEELMAVVQVEQVLHSPPTFSQLAGDRVTVRLASAAEEGQRFAFFTRGIAFAENVTVAEVGRLSTAQVAPRLARAEESGGRPFEDLLAEIESDRLREHAEDATAVIVGRVRKLEKVGDAGWSQHDPDWWKATVEVRHVEKGDLKVSEVEILYPNSLDAQWHQVPKPRAGQEGVFILHASNDAVRPLGAFQILHPEDLRHVGSLQAPTPTASEAPRAGGAEARTPEGRSRQLVRIINMIPRSLSGETNQDSGPNIAVDPQDTNSIVGTALTPAPMGGEYAPIYASTDGGNTWALNMILPGNGPRGTWNSSVAFAQTGGELFAGVINGASEQGVMEVLSTSDFTATIPMSVLLARDDAAQPWVVAANVLIEPELPKLGGLVAEARLSPLEQERVGMYVGSYNGETSPRTATVDLSLGVSTGQPAGGFETHLIEQVEHIEFDGPSTRIAVHTDGTAYAAFERFDRSTLHAFFDVDVVVTRDDDGGTGATSFRALGEVGSTVAASRNIVLGASGFSPFTMGQERRGFDLAIAVDPRNSSNVWVAWCDEGEDVQPWKLTEWTLHVRRSTDRGKTWSDDLRAIIGAKNPALAINTNGELGLLYQALSGPRWVTELELTSDGWATPAATMLLHTAPSSTPARGEYFPYIGDYIRMIAIGTGFYGIFCGNNTPDLENFPSGITYQREADWATKTLLASDGTSPVAPSIDPFFFHYTPPLIVEPPESIHPIKDTTSAE